jgi:hypothetical protein
MGAPNRPVRPGAAESDAARGRTGDIEEVGGSRGAGVRRIVEVVLLFIFAATWCVLVVSGLLRTVV